MNVLALCAGGGGLELGLRLAVPAAHCVCHVEGEVFAVATLVEQMEAGWLDQAPVWSDVRTFDGRPWRGLVDLVSGGYPCQPFSLAGRRGGESDPRHLWPSIRRIVGEVAPEWCFFENVPGHVSLGLEAVLDDLLAMGYTPAAGLFTASEVGASHKRERLFILAHTVRTGSPGRTVWARDGDPERSPAERVCGDALDDSDIPVFPPGPGERGVWAGLLARRPDLEPAIRRMAHGLANRVDRLRCLGNGVVPLVAAHAFLTLRDSLAYVPRVQPDQLNLFA